MLTSFRKDRLLAAKNYVLYYGYGKLKELSSFDVAIVDPNSLHIEEFKQLRLHNTLVITYISIFEVHPTEPIFKELTKNDFLQIDGEPIINEEFGTYLVSLRSETWVRYLLSKINHQFQTIESDGLFLDTIGDLDLHSLPNSLRRLQIQALVNFLTVIKMLYPNHVMIQNNGLEYVIQATGPYIDAICWENPPFSLPESNDWNQLILRKLSQLKEKYKLQILLLLEELVEKERNSYNKARKIAKNEQFLLYHAPNKYVEGVNVLKFNNK